MQRVLLVATVLWVAAMLLSLKYGFLDQFVTRSVPQELGLDFFQAPCGFENIVNECSVFLTEASQYNANGYGTPYFNHPLLAVVVGLWTVPFSPWVAYGLFVTISVLLLVLSAYLLSSVLDSRSAKAFAYLALFCSPTVYLLLHVGNMHIFVVLSVAMILTGLIRLVQNPEESGRLIQAGILISLFSKPVALLMLPLLLLLPETRRKIVVPVAIYAGVSLLFLLVPRLNPGGYNATHWLNLFRASLSSSHPFWFIGQNLVDYANNPTIFSLPRLVPGFICQIILVAVLLCGGLTILLSGRVDRLRAAIATIILCVLSHYLCYYVVLEYQYTAILPTIPALLWLKSSEKSRNRRTILTVALVAAAWVLLPTCKVFFDNWLAVALWHIVPVVIASTALVGYVLAVALSNKLTFNLTTKSLIPASLLLATVFVAAYATIPNRLLVASSKWTPRDWIDHYESIVEQPGIKPDAQFYLHRQLAIAYADSNPGLALQHYQEANKITTRHAALTVEMADVLFSVQQKTPARKLLASLSVDEISEPKVRQRYKELRRVSSQADSPAKYASP